MTRLTMTSLVGLSARIAAAMSAAAILIGCAHNAGVATGPIAKTELRERKNRCDVIEQSLTPDRVAGGGFTVLNFGLKGEYRTDHVNNVKDEYLTALQALLVDCREWQNLEINNQEWREARRRFSLVYTSKLDAASVNQAIGKLGEIFTSGRSDQQNAATRIQEEVKSLGEALAGNHYSVDTRIRDLTDQVAALRSDLLSRQSSSITSTAVSPPLELPITELDHRVLKTRWILSFSVGSAVPNAADVETTATALKQLKARDPAISFQLSGFSDSLGDKRANLSLAIRRVENVRRALDERGVYSVGAVAVGETEAFGASLGSNRVVVVTAFRPLS